MGNYTATELHDLYLSANKDRNPTGFEAWQAAAVALAESGGNPQATGHNTNGTTDIGLWQINSSHGAEASYDPVANARAAYAIRHGANSWAPWCTAWGDGACGTKGGKYGAVDAPAWKIYLSDWFTKLTKGTSGGQAPGKGDIPIVGPVLGALPSSSPLSWTESLAKVLSFLGNGQFWLRVGQGLVAAILLLVGGGLVFRKDATALIKAGALA